MDHSFSDKLLLIPLFQGFSRLDFLDVVEKVPFEFRSFKAGTTLLEQDQESRRLVMILNGTILCRQADPRHVYELSEVLSAPLVVQPECLFGLHNRYTRTVEAFTDVQSVAISKQSVFELMHRHLSFQVNLLNTICSETQQRSRLLWTAFAPSLRTRFRQFLSQRSLSPRGEKTLRIRMEELADELGTSRLAVSRLIETLRQERLVTHSRGIMHIAAMEKI